MRIAVVSDIHGNLTALEAVVADLRRVAPDVVLHGGDLVGSGSHPAEVVDRVRDLQWPGIQGNCEEMLRNPARVADYFAAPPLRHWRPIVDRAAAATLDAIGGERLAWLQALPYETGHGNLMVVHARPGDCWSAPGPDAADEDLAQVYGTLDAGTVIYGHIHFPYVRQLADLTVGNAGSVSLSYDGDSRAAYAVIDDQHVTIRRVEYDVEREIAALVQRKCPDADWIAAMLRSATPLPP